MPERIADDFRAIAQRLHKWPAPTAISDDFLPPGWLLWRLTPPNA